MLTPEQIDQMSHPIIEIYSQLETDLFNAIVNRLKTESADEITKDNVLKWQMEKLMHFNDLNKDTIKLLSQLSGKTVKSLNELVQNAGIQGVKPMDDWLIGLVADGIVQEAPELERDERIVNTLKTFQKQAISDMNMVNGTILQNVGQVYRDIIAKTTASVMAGTKSFQQALLDTSNQWVDKGLPALVDNAGRKWSIEGYVPMVVKSTANNVANQTQFDRMDSYGIDLVEISSHLGARPLCAPYQGRIFDRNGKSKKYPALDSTSMGKPAGLFGINCHHHPYPYIEGVSNKTYNPYPTQENAEQYQTFQQQRSLERDIRKAKRKLNVAQKLGNEQQIAIAKQKVRDKHAQMRTFIEENNVTRRRNREQLHIDNPHVGGGKSNNN